MARLTLDRFFQLLIALTALSAVLTLNRANAQDLPLEVIGTYRVDEVIRSSKQDSEKKRDCKTEDGKPRHFACGETVRLVRKGDQLLILKAKVTDGKFQPFRLSNRHCERSVKSRSVEELFETNICRAFLTAEAGEKGEGFDVFVFTPDLNPKQAAADEAIRSWSIGAMLGIPGGVGFSAASRIKIPANGSVDRLILDEVTSATLVLLIVPFTTEIYRSYELVRIMN